MELKYNLLILGIGNILHGDDGFGSQVITELQSSYLFPETLGLIDGGIMGLSLLPFIEQAKEVIIIDTVVMKKEPGTIYKFPLADLQVSEEASLNLHELGISEVLQVLRAEGREVQGTVIGIEPLHVSPWTTQLSNVIEEKIPEIMEMVIEELHDRGYQAVSKNMINASSKRR